jgi:hypothetical protein
MQAYRFENFQVLPENRGAYDRCLRVANLEPGSASPLVVVGGPAQGKTHLLWSIVNRVRENHPSTALVLITAREFPERVKMLARDPEPIRRSRNAVLLVDSLAQFRDDADDLEAVVDVFLQSRFAVVLASSVLPIQIEAFSPAFRRRLTAADMVTVGGRPLPGTAMRAVQPMPIAPQRDTPRIAELEARNGVLIAERDALTAKLERSQRRVVQLEEEIAALLQKYAALEASERQGRDASRELVRVQGELEAARVDARTAAEERDAVRATLRQLEADNERLRGELQHAADVVKAELESTVEAARLQADHAVRDAETQHARAQEAMEEAENARQQMRQLAQQSLGVLEYLTAIMPEASDTSAEAHALIAEFVENLRSNPATAAEMLPLRLEQLVSGEESAAQRALRAQLAEAASERELQAGLYEDARAAQSRLDVELGVAQSRIAALTRERDVARQTQAMLLAELDALRDQTREELSKAQRDIAAMRWQASALAEQVLLQQDHDWQEISRAIASLTDASGSDDEAPAQEPELFPEAERGRALLSEIAGQLAAASRAPVAPAEEAADNQSESGPLSRAIEDALGEV